MNELQGRWDLTIGTGEDAFPSWLEVSGEGGRFVGRVGSARPLGSVVVGDGWITVTLPPQYESRSTELSFHGDLINGSLVGKTVLDDGSEASWVGTRAPSLPSSSRVAGEHVDLIELGLDHWRPRTPDWENHWRIENGSLVNGAVGTDLVTLGTYQDFQLVAEYTYPKGSNSGIYLRGRYEFQILDDYESQGTGVGNSGAIYGFLAPTSAAIKLPEEWNRAEITLDGRFITVDLNGIRIHDKVEIPGITGGALDSREGEPGPIFLQGDHGPVTFRLLTIAPLV